MKYLFPITLLASLALAACGAPGPDAAGHAQASETMATQAEADAFFKRFNDEQYLVDLDQSRAEWVMQTYITSDTEYLSAKASERALNFTNQLLEQAKRFQDLSLQGDVARGLHILKTDQSMPAPRDPAKVAELAAVASRLSSMYGQGKYCNAQGECRELEALMKIMAESRDYDELLDAWTGWRTISPPMRADYQRFAQLMNDGARELGYKDTGELWKARYDMSPEEFETEDNRLWDQVKPLYEQLQCYVRDKLGDVYGRDKVRADHLLGNMWAQEWGNIYPLMQPYPASGGQKVDISASLQEQGYDATRMFKSAESFYTSMGLKTLPDSFWEKSMLVKPRDREVVCHPSAWDMDPAVNDVRIKMCTDPTEEDLVTIYHELGHIYYYLYYSGLPTIFRRGAHDGFHEAIGDALTLSMTPGYYQKVGLLGDYREDQHALINYQMKEALDKIAFLPFGKLIDQWRWDVFAGKVPPEQYNQYWWDLRTRYQGIRPPVARSESDFDPGAKYHIPANTPYTRYFLARILQFQFHKAMCDAAGFKGPLYQCSIYGSKEAGEKLASMLALGNSKPWPDALEALTGKREMDAGPLIEYFQPLMGWLEQENRGKTCGW
jgi:peptidyl-dipeptidase A